jgi:hypothetical protein
MARGRMVSRSLSTSERRAALHTVAGPLAEFAQGLYVLLVVHSDDFGREQGDVATVKFAVDPTSPRPLEDFRAALKALHVVGLIQWYSSDDPNGGAARTYIQINSFEQHQTGLHKRTKSHFPGPTGKFPEIPHQQNRTEQNGTEGNRTYVADPHGTSPAVQPGVPKKEPPAAREIATCGNVENSARAAGESLSAEGKTGSDVAGDLDDREADQDRQQHGLEGRDQGDRGPRRIPVAGERPVQSGHDRRRAERTAPAGPAIVRPARTTVDAPAGTVDLTRTGVGFQLGPARGAEPPPEAVDTLRRLKGRLEGAS